jgi:hypothetical protein
MGKMKEAAAAALPPREPDPPAPAPAPQVQAQVPAKPKSSNPFQNIGNRSRSRGQLAFYRQGDWYFGKDKIELGTKMLALVDQAEEGWERWEGGQIVESWLHPCRDEVEKEPRETMGYTDEGEWETNDNGDPQDPLSYRTYLPMEDPETHEIVRWVFWSDGAMGAWERLCDRYAPFYGTNKYPVVSLGSGSYFNKRHRKDTAIPVLRIERWENYGAPLQGEAEAEIIPPDPKPQKTYPSDRITTGGPPKRDSEMDDSIPFGPEFR